MSLKNVGETLRQERIRQGLSLDDVAAITKISPHTLEALEEGDMGSSPHHVYIKGFVKTYASILKIDPRKLGEEVDQVFKDMGVEVPKPSPLMSQPYISPEVKKSSSGGKLLLMLVFLGLAVVLVWAGFTYLPGGDDADQGAAVQETDDSSSQALLFPGSGDNGAGVDVAVPDLPEAVDEAAANATQDGPQDAAETAGPPAEGHLLRITAVDDCWLKFDADGVNSTEALLYAGQNLDVPFSELLTIRFGNLGGVRLVYDGQVMELNATEGAAKTLVFPPQE